MSVPLTPMLPSAGPLPRGPDWGFEFKWDGMRALVAVDARVRVIARRGDDYATAFPELAVMGEQFDDTVIDGEIIALDERSRPSFALVAKRFSNRRPDRGLLAAIPVSLMVFDVLRLRGVDVAAQPYRQRRETLAELEPAGGPWLVPPWNTDGPAMLAAAVESGLEGVVAKRLDSPYRPGRSRDWIKVKTTDTADVVIGGWRSDVRSLLVGTPNEHGTLTYRGRVGSGLTDTLIRDYRSRLTRSGRCPFEPPPPLEYVRDVVWTEPDTVVEVAFSHLTGTGVMRHPRYLRARPDKVPGDIEVGPPEPGAAAAGDR